MLTAHEVVIAATPDTVWSIYADVERWPSWTASVRRVELLDGATSLSIGARARITQPRLPRVVWTVTELDPGRSWTWRAGGPGATTVASHDVEPHADGTIVRSTIAQHGLVGAVIGRLTRRLTTRYLALEAEGLRRRAESDAAPA